MFFEVRSSIFQSLSRAQCLCHRCMKFLEIRTGASFNRSVALNAFATNSVEIGWPLSLPTFNRSVALNAFATLQNLTYTLLFSYFLSLSRAQCLCHTNKTLAGRTKLIDFQSRSRAQCLCDTAR